MRIILRIFAIIMWLAVVGTLRLIWRIWDNGTMGVAMTGTLGVITALGWAMTLGLGPFAAIQLWRLHESGRKASLFLAFFALLYYVVGWLFFREPSLATAKIWLPIGGNLFFALLLMSSPARHLFKVPMPEPRQSLE